MSYAYLFKYIIIGDTGAWQASCRQQPLFLALRAAPRRVALCAALDVCGGAPIRPAPPRSASVADPPSSSIVQASVSRACCCSSRTSAFSRCTTSRLASSSALA